MSPDVFAPCSGRAHRWVIARVTTENILTLETGKSFLKETTL